MAKNRPKTKAAIVILTRNAVSMTNQVLRDVSNIKSGNLDLECIVVDNDSNDETYKELANYKLSNMKYKFLQSGSNLGFAGGNNIGIKYAVNKGNDYIVLLNNDVIIPPDLIAKMVDFMDKHPKAGTMSPKMYFAKGYEFHKNRYQKMELGNVIWYAGGTIDWQNIYSRHRGVDEVDKGQYDEIALCDFVNGAAMIVRSEVFKSIGFLDKSLFLYWEDADFSQRVKNAGYGVYYFPGTHIWHKVSSSTGGSGSKTNDYFLTRNRLYFAYRYAKLRTKFAVAKDTAILLFKGRRWQKIGAGDALIGRKGKGRWA